MSGGRAQRSRETAIFWRAGFAGRDRSGCRSPVRCSAGKCPKPSRTVARGQGEYVSGRGFGQDNGIPGLTGRELVAEGQKDERTTAV